MKNTLFTVFFLLLFITTQAQSNSMREVVAIIRPVYSESTVKFLNVFAERLEKQNYDSLAVHLKRYAKGSSFGSGFAYMNPTDSQTYILTNRHVVAQAQTVNVEFALEDQSVKSFTNCKIVSVDFDNDLALISLPDRVKLGNVLTMSTQKAEDAEDVFTAGYPGLADKPSWQLGKGIVSNSSLRVDGWIQSKNAIIQHTAQIDPGSSGGPLLRRNPNAPRGFEVIGMNTWKVRDRENANFSIHASVIRSFIEAYFNGEGKNTKEGLQKRVQDFIGVSKDGYKPILPYVSYEYIAKISPDKFFELLSSSTPEIKKDILKQFSAMYPLEAVRVTISSILSKKVSQQDLSFESIENFSTTGPVTVNLKNKNKTIKTTWILDQGLWRLSDMSSIKFEDDRKVKVDNSYGYDGSITYLKSTDMGHSDVSYTELLTQNTIKTFYTSGAGFSFGNMYKPPMQVGDAYTNKFLGVLSHYGVQLPVKIGPVHLVPYARAIVGLDVFGDIFNFNASYGYRLGLEANLHLIDDTYLITGFGFRNKTYFFPENAGFAQPSTNSLSLFIGISY